MNLFLAFIVAFAFSSLVFTFANDAGKTIANENKAGESSHANVKGSKKVKAEKNVKTNGEISTAGCETANGKTISENDFGYDDCVKQIGLKK